MTNLLGVEYTFKSINPISFYFRKRKEGVVSGFAVVMTILHFLPRLQDKPVISDNFRMLTGRHPNSISDFILREKDQLEGN